MKTLIEKIALDCSEASFALFGLEESTREQMALDPAVDTKDLKFLKDCAEARNLVYEAAKVLRRIHEDYKEGST